MTRIVALSLLVALVGITIVLSELRWFRLLPLQERLAPFLPGRSALAGGVDRSFQGAIGPMVTDLGARLSRTLGVGEDLEARLQRIGSPLSPTQFRARQLGIALLVALVAAVLLLIIAPPVIVVLPVALGVPLLAFLVIEQQSLKASKQHQQRVVEELPVVAEQLGMFFSAGMSLTGALQRAATRSDGACARDLKRVCARVAQGINPERALNEWAVVAQSAPVHRLVSILLLHQQTTDLGTLISAEARAVRQESQRRLVERIERRNEQVWIPVTVATLVPGVIFLAIPFTDTLKEFGAL